MGSDTENVIDTLFSTTLERIQCAIETSNERGSGSYIISPDWILSTKATINPENENDNKCF